jgi:hypothetical protein
MRDILCIRQRLDKEHFISYFLYSLGIANKGIIWYYP